MAEAPSQSQLMNGGFEAGSTGWDLTDGPWSIGTTPGNAYEGNGYLEISSSDGDSNGALNSLIVPVYPGQKIVARARIRTISSSKDYPQGEIGTFVVILWLNEAGIPIARTDAPTVGSRGLDTGWRLNSVVGTAPPGAEFARFAIFNYNLGSGNISRVDACEWNYAFDRKVSISSPATGSEHKQGSVITFQATVAGTTPPVKEVYYKSGTTVLGRSSASPFTVNYSGFPIGEHSVVAVAVGTDGSEVESSPITVNVISAFLDREYRASNSYTYLVAENISGLSSSLPLSAKIMGVELLVDYSMAVLMRTLDEGVSDPAAASTNVAFDIVNGGTLEAIMLEPSGEGYSVVGNGAIATIPIEREAFELTEESTTDDGRKWAVLQAEDASVVLGSETETFGLEAVSAGDFLDRALGIRFYPNLGSIPQYTLRGDACYRLFINKVRARIYFDAGSVEYYFASPDKSHIVKGRLVSAEVLDGDLRTADASGVLQLAPELEVMDGYLEPTVYPGYTIHAAYPPTDANQIGVVSGEFGAVGMEYNGLPTQKQVKDNRSRYMFISANFYGDKKLASMYGANGYDRGFAYNGDWFYKIYTQPDTEKDKPRHVAYHHAHLALGYDEGRVDISVVGEPYNFTGLDGASSWTIGDKVVGLLSLSGTVLGVFGSKSVWGISGTTVDNFATQVISPNIGATEYTICDMGSPVYANAYGIYTLEQVQQYGDFMGTPLSQDISPWLRPRLVRKSTSDKEVVAAWPVRSKNQYRLAFSDGYITSMTMNGAGTPTFSLQKYFYQPDPVNPYVSDDLYSYPSMVPAAVSSELSDDGEERIHMAPYVEDVKEAVAPVPPPVPSVCIPASTTTVSYIIHLDDPLNAAKGMDVEVGYPISRGGVVSYDGYGVEMWDYFEVEEGSYTDVPVTDYYDGTYLGCLRLTVVPNA
jgi:hypothetical protein